MLKTIFIIALLSLTGCLASAPTVNRCGYSWKFQKFRCKNTKTKVSFDVKLDDPMMEDAQALPVNDEFKSYQAAEDYFYYIQEQAERCN